MGDRRLLLAAVLLTALCWPATAPASTTQESIMMDDDLLLYRGDHVRARTLNRMRQFGVDSVHVTVLWSYVAADANLSNAEIRRLKSASARRRARKQRSRFRPENPRTYPRRNWDAYDNLLKEAATLKMPVHFTVTGPGPSFGHRKAPRNQRRNRFSYKPVASRFRAFVKAVGKRYSGAYKDENAIKQVLPRVATWSLWNEPNQSGWLSPQWERRGGSWVPASPAIYRSLYRSGVEGLVATGHGNDRILLGETAPLGTSKRGYRSAIRPTPFLRELLCLTPTGASYTGTAASYRVCANFIAKGPLKASGFAHHAYTKKRAPTVQVAHPEELTMANVATWGPLLDKLSVQSGGKIRSGLPITVSEFGYETKPPDPRNGISQAKQAKYNQLGDFLAFNTPRVTGVTQFLLRDARPLRQFKKNSRMYWFTYQTGLFTRGGKAKPSATAYLLPFVVYVRGPGVLGFWGHLRFRPNKLGDVAVVQWRPNAQSPWQQLGPAAPTNASGYFTKVSGVPSPNSQYRAVWVDPATGKVRAASLPTTP